MSCAALAPRVHQFPGCFVSDSINLKNLFKRAVDLMKENADREAELICLQALETDSGDVNFMALLGTSLMRQGLSLIHI